MNYEMLHISPENIAREKQVFEDISQCINKKKSWVFDAGAGAGKTYALIQTLKLIINQASRNFKKHNQKILCITYTNVAADEIKERLGATTLIDVSTIHDRVWDIIADHQIQLVEIHRDKLVHEVDGIKSTLKTEQWAEKYQSLSEEKQSLLLEIMGSKKLIYYKHKQDNAKEFKAEFSDVNERFPEILRNVGNFKKVIDRLYRIQNYEEAIAKIDEKDKRFSKVKYDARFNDDRLEKMRISHDTLLEYTEKLVSMNDMLKQIICDQYPFVLVDEYQDTNPLVIKTLSAVDEYAKKIAHTFLVGYYGDVKQNIYDKGVGSHFYSLHEGLERVEKVFNRRCSPEIISVANKIRNDGLTQESIYEEFPDSSVSFYNMEVDRQQFITAYIKKWNIDEKNKLHCFELTNERVAEQSGFSDIYNFFKNSKWYNSGKRYEFLRDHVLSLDENKLGIVQKLLFRILNFKYRLSRDNTMLLDIFQENQMKDVNISILRDLLDKMQNISGETLGEYVISIFNAYRKGDNKYDKCIEYVVAEEIKSYEELKQFVLNHLYYFSEDEEPSDEDIQKNEKEVDDFFKISMNTFALWHNFITDTCIGEVIYHTYHGTKGREFDNVIIFMNSKFGRKSNYFSDLLKVLPDKNEQQEIGTDLESARNLLYVAVTRATKNLCIVYLDDLGEAVQPVQIVFGEIKSKL